MDTRIKAVIFDEENHRYFYDGKELRGVTGVIGKLMGKNFPDTDVVKLSTIYGHDVHKESEDWINEGRLPSSESGKWLIETLQRLKENLKGTAYEAEVTVSDFKTTASKVDVVLHTRSNEVYLFDIKTTSHFDRSYCSLQLSVYKKLYEMNYGEKVQGMFVLGTKSKRLFRVFEQRPELVDKVLRMNEEGKSNADSKE